MHAFRVKLFSFFAISFAVVLFIIILPLLILYWIYRTIKGLILGLWAALTWYSKGKKALFVYSDSPIWKEHLEKEFLHKIKPKSYILNWSERSSWPDSLEKRIFLHWSNVMQVTRLGKPKWDGREYCPIAIIFNSWWNPKVIRFWDAYKAFKHGKKTELSRLENEMLEALR